MVHLQPPDDAGADTHVPEQASKAPDQTGEGKAMCEKFFASCVALCHSCATISTSTTKILCSMIPITKSAYLSVRLPDKARLRFHAKAKKFGTPSEVLRELIDAFIEDRITIQPPVNRNPKENLYEPRIQN